ncbi:phosphoglycerate mutase [Caballeronia temeraria]|uniref:Phosphoglycerate mutase n=1 Tax=Caballeronia temeraria TaxID=1777137 RepID=A0A157Z2D5_9BURK|nr:histidine phosphatase family protein [Caballeronia temeraria]SAK39642.1 phosphoglycerate mutase [Caballeronia temeraria]
MDFVLIRHPEVIVDTGVCYGQTDVPLQRDVRDLASALNARMTALNVPACIDGWHASPLQRCASLAHELGGHAHIDARLGEMNFGAWEGRAWDSIDRALIDAWAGDIEHACPHGGESLAQFAHRVIAWFDATCIDQRAVHVVAHAGVVRVLAAHLLGIARESALQWPLDFGAIVWFRRVRGQWLIVRWNA